MGKNKKRSGGGEQGQQPKPAEEYEEKAAHADDEKCEKKEAEDNQEKEKRKDKEDNRQQDKGKKSLPVVTAVLKVDMHCDGCVKRIRASVRHYPGVEGVAMEVDKGTMTMVGRFDAKKLRDRVAEKTKKKVDLFCNNQNKGNNDGSCNKNNQKKGNDEASCNKNNQNKGNHDASCNKNNQNMGNDDASSNKNNQKKGNKNNKNSGNDDAFCNKNNQSKVSGNNDASCNKKQEGDFKVHEYDLKPNYMYDFYWLDTVYGGCDLPVDIKALHDYHAMQDKDKPSKKDTKSCGRGGEGRKTNKEDNDGSGGGGRGKAREDNNGERKDKEDKDCGGDDKGKDGKDSMTVPVVGTVMLMIGSMGLHCDGCMKCIRCKLFKIKGVEQVTMDMDKDLVMVTGTMDIKDLPGILQKKMRRQVDVVPANKEKKKDKEKEMEEEKEKKDKNKMEEEKKNDGNKHEGCKDTMDKKYDNKQEERCMDKDIITKLALTSEMLMRRTAFYDQHSLLNSEFMFSDENPNACSLM